MFEHFDRVVRSKAEYGLMKRVVFEAMLAFPCRTKGFSGQRVLQVDAHSYRDRLVVFDARKVCPPTIQRLSGLKRRVFISSRIEDLQPRHEGRRAPASEPEVANELPSRSDRLGIEARHGRGRDPNIEAQKGLGDSLQIRLCGDPLSIPA